MQDVLQVQQALAFALGHALYGYARPGGNHLGDVLLRHHALAGQLGFFPFGALIGNFIAHSMLAVAQARGALIILMIDGLLLFAGDAGQLLLLGLEIGRGGKGGDAHARGGLVHQIHRLIRQVAIGDVARGERDGGAKGLVRDAHAVVRLVFIAQAAQNFKAFVLRGLIHRDGLEAAGQRSILLDVLAVFVARGRADALQFAPGEGGLEDVGRVHRAFTLACADDVLQFVDKENHVACGADFAHQVFEPLFKLAAELGACHQRADIQRDQAFADQRFRDGSGDHALRQPFGHGGFANAGLADQHGVVLGAA